MSVKPYFAITASIILTSIAQLTFKWALKNLPEHVFYAQDLIPYLQHFYPSLVALFIGIGMYLLSMLFWLIALTKIPLSRAYPLLALSYVIVYLVATSLSLFQESASHQAFLGVTLIILGVTLTSTRGLDIRSSYCSFKKK